MLGFFVCLFYLPQNFKSEFKLFQFKGYKGKLTSDCDVLEIQGPVPDMDQMALQWGQDPGRIIPPSGQLHLDAELLPEQDRACPGAPYSNSCSGFCCCSTSRLNKEGASDPGSSSLILLLSGVRCYRGDRGQFLRCRSSYASLILENEAETSQESLPRSLWGVSDPAHHHWQQEVSVPQG